MTRTFQSICDSQNFERLFKAHSKVLRSFIYYKCGNMDLTEDIVQDAFVTLWQNCHKVSYEEALYYLKRVSYNNYMFDGSAEFSSHISELKEDLKLYNKKDYDIGQKSKEEIEWGLDHIGPRSLFSREVLSKQHGIAIARTLNNYFLTRATHVRDIAYALHYLSPKRTQLNQLDDYLNFASQDLEQNVAMVKGKLNTLENELKKNKLPEGNIRKWLDQKSMDWASFGVEYADTIGFSGYCEGCFDLALVNLGDYRKGLLYINDKSKLLPIKYGSYLTLIPIQDSWYFYTTY